MSITPEETIKILTAKAECMRRETSGIDIDCNYRNCDECDLCYKQGTTGDQIEALGVAISALQAQDLQPTCNNLVTDTISRKTVRYKLTALVNEFEEILSHIREREVDDSVCGLCEYDGAYIGQSGDWCNECPGFEKDDCFKLKEKYKKEWTDING